MGLLCSRKYMYLHSNDTIVFLRMQLTINEHRLQVPGGKPYSWIENNPLRWYIYVPVVQVQLSSMSIYLRAEFTKNESLLGRSMVLVRTGIIMLANSQNHCSIWKQIHRYLVTTTFCDTFPCNQEVRTGAHTINTLRPNEAHMHQYNILILLQIMICRLFSAKPLSESMLPYCRLDHKKHTSVKSSLKFKGFHSRNCTLKCRMRIGGHFV